ncbi:MAG: TatD family hydrolase [Lentisphaeria bacterium]|nr:TatD family hydrolase [Lentisphaeria bacterium]
MEIFDTHFHLSAEDTFEDFLSRCRNDLQLASKDFAVPVDRLLMLCAGSNCAESVRAMEFAGYAENVYFSCGIHPHAATEYLAGEKPDFSIFLNHEKLAAVGEIGLDYFYDFSDEASQKTVLEEFLQLALEWNLPAMLHLRDKDNCRKVYDDALAMLGPFAGAGGRFVIHCYAGNAADAEKFLALGGYFGVTGMYTFKAASNIREAIAVVPDERILIETDSPYLAPVPYRGRSNTPGMVPLVALALGAQRQMLPEKAAEIFSANGRRFYGINL